MYKVYFRLSKNLTPATIKRGPCVLVLFLILSYSNSSNSLSMSNKIIISCFINKISLTKRYVHHKCSTLCSCGRLIISSHRFNVHKIEAQEQCSTIHLELASDILETTIQSLCDQLLWFYPSHQSNCCTYLQRKIKLLFSFKLSHQKCIIRMYCNQATDNRNYSINFNTTLMCSFQWAIISLCPIDTTYLLCIFK